MKQQRIFFSVLFGIIALLAVIVMQPFLSYIVLAGILTYTLFTVYHF
jgi:predicted PurR-regulated permease PerM